MNKLTWCLLLLWTVSVSAAPASQKATGKVAAAPAGKNMLKNRSRSVASDAPIEVRGQSRNLNMLLILQNQKEEIDFIKLRNNYQPETKRMNY